MSFHTFTGFRFIILKVGLGLCNLAPFKLGLNQAHTPNLVGLGLLQHTVPTRKPVFWGVK